MYNQYLLYAAIAVAAYMLWKAWKNNQESPEGEALAPSQPRAQASESPPARPKPLASLARHAADVEFDNNVIRDIRDAEIDRLEEGFDKIRQRRRPKSGSDPKPPGSA